MSPPSHNRFRRSVRWLLPAALLALTPKCFLCLAAYAGIGLALGLGGPEFCGAAPDTTDTWLSTLAIGGAVLGIFATVAHLRK